MKQIKRLQIGKKGLTDEFIGQVKSIFKNEQLVKISILKSATRNKMEAQKIAEQLVDELGKKYTHKLVGYTLIIRKWRKDKRP